MILLRVFAESLRFALQALRLNPLRTALSLLGVSIGVFCIIAILTAVDGLDKGVKNSFNFLGDRVIYVQVFPFGFGEGEYPWWKYIRRPQPKYEEYEFLKANSKWAEAVSLVSFRPAGDMRHKNNTVSGITLMGATHAHNKVISLPVEQGRYFTPQEMESGQNVVLIGDKTAKELFPYEEAVGQQIKIKGVPFRVIGRMPAQGKSLIPTPSNDELCVIPYNRLRRMFDLNGRIICAKGKADDVGLGELLGELKGLLRAKRGLKPMQEDNFALNRTEALAEFVQKLSDGLKLGGFVIGMFSILVGGFGIANIMFVSVKERTSQIGIQKALGAKNYFILWQFLFESLILSLMGGVAGLLTVGLITVALSSVLPFPLSMGWANILSGLLISSIVGVAAGLIPALQAARMDPVEAMRSK